MLFHPPLPVAVLGATSLLGQHLIVRLATHPWFHLVAVAEKQGSQGPSSLSYAQGADWQCVACELPTAVATLPLLPCHPTAFPGVKMVFSALTTPDAESIEAACAEAGMAVLSVASQDRLAPDMPLLLPAVNADHVAALHLQRKQRAWLGWIVANAHPAAATLAQVLKPLQEAFGLEQVLVTPWHAVSGANVGEQPARDTLDQATADRVREAHQIERETRTLLGGFDDEWGFLPSPVRISVHGNPAASSVGQALGVRVQLAGQATCEDLLVAWDLGSVQEIRLPSAPTRVLSYRQPLFARDAGPERERREALDAMTMHIGQLRSGSDLDFTFSVLGPNPIRSAARHALWQAEYLLRKGYVERWNWLHILAGQRERRSPRGRRCA